MLSRRVKGFAVVQGCLLAATVLRHPSFNKPQNDKPEKTGT